MARGRHSCLHDTAQKFAGAIYSSMFLSSSLKASRLSQEHRYISLMSRFRGSYLQFLSLLAQRETCKDLKGKPHLPRVCFRARFPLCVLLVTPMPSAFPTSPSYKHTFYLAPIFSYTIYFIYIPTFLHMGDPKWLTSFYPHYNPV